MNIISAKDLRYSIIVVVISAWTAFTAQTSEGRTNPVRGAATPGEVYAAFATAIANKDLRVFMKVCSKPLANFGPGFTCGTLLNEAWHQGRTFQKVAEVPASDPKKRAYIELSTTGDDKLTAPIFFLLEQNPYSLWELRNIHANRGFADTYIKR
jgi:hypothetical protein